MSINITENIFGEAKNPISGAVETIKKYRMDNKCGMTVEVITLGATVTSIRVPDVSGAIDDVVLGYDDIAGYQQLNNPYLGATIGRVCNRIANGQFNLDGKKIEVTKNFSRQHHLHGGFIGFDKVHWEAQIDDNRDAPKLIMTHTSMNGHEGYPGEVKAIVTFQLTIDNCLNIQFVATTDQPTPINLTNHSYFNLAGHDMGCKEIYNHELKIDANQYTVTDSDSIPTGVLKYVEATPYDLRTIGNLGNRLEKLKTNGFNDNFCIDTKDDIFHTFAWVHHPKSGRTLEVTTDQPGVQFYTSNYFPDPELQQEPIKGKNGAKYMKHGAFCLETQKYPDSVNHENFPSTIVRPGEVYNHFLNFKFGTY